LGDTQAALADLALAIAHGDQFIFRLEGGNLLAGLGRHEEALADFAIAKVMAPQEWNESWGPLYVASSLACLGREAEALEVCARLPEDHWSPGLCGAPAGNKAEVLAEIRSILG
jgi:hypothetical protein